MAGDADGRNQLPERLVCGLVGLHGRNWPIGQCRTARSLSATSGSGKSCGAKCRSIRKRKAEPTDDSNLDPRRYPDPHLHRRHRRWRRPLPDAVIGTRRPRAAGHQVSLSAHPARQHRSPGDPPRACEERGHPARREGGRVRSGVEVFRAEAGLILQPKPHMTMRAECGCSPHPVQMFLSLRCDSSGSKC